MLVLNCFCILLGIFLTVGGHDTYANIRECRFLDRINCDDCPAPLMFKCGGDIEFVKPESTPNSLFVSVVPSSTSITDDDLSESKKKELIKFMGEAADDMDDSQVFRFELEIPSNNTELSVGNITGWTSDGASTSKTWVRRQIADKVHKKSDKKYTQSEILRQIDDPTSDMAGLDNPIGRVVFNMNDNDLYNDFREKSGEKSVKAEGFCYYSSVPQVVGVTTKEDKKQCNEKFCFAHIKCVENNKFDKRFIACSALSDDRCPSAGKCKKNPIDNIRESRNFDLAVIPIRKLPKKGRSSLVSSRERQEDPVYTSQPRIVGFSFLDPEGNKASCSTQFCVADVNLGKRRLYADTSAICKAKKNECPPVKECLDYDETIVVNNLKNQGEVKGVSILAESLQVSESTKQNNESRDGGKGFDGGNADSGRGFDGGDAAGGGGFDGGERRNNMNDSGFDGATR